ncbi:hypothetical protein DDM80_18325 [Vibrio cholerae]|nr:hypothetical protein [Vibrio cholerae]EGR4255152.1 hypothetical protein [Vibrio cholerae]ELJ8609122.1 hypothetical protein [Vibrio cholerae]HDI3168141.1 hypothetical protein [Vibrio cholerae]
MLESLFLLLPIAAAYGWMMGRKTVSLKKMRGWIELNIEEKHYNDFVNLLNGFERYAKLQGFSVKHDFSDKKKYFSIIFGTQAYNKEELIEEFESYLGLLQDDKLIYYFFDNAKTARDILEITKLQNQLISIKANLECERNNNEFLKSIIKDLSTSKATVSVSSNVALKGEYMKKTYNVSNSSGVIAGEGNFLIKRSNVNTGGVDKNDLVNVINKLMVLIDRENNTDEINELKRLIVNAKEEIDDEEVPNKIRLERWLMKAKKVSELSKNTLINGREILELLNSLHDKFL